VPLEPGAFARPGQPDRQDDSALRLPRLVRSRWTNRCCCRFTDLRRRVSFGAFTGGTARRRQRGSLRRLDRWSSLLASTTAPSSTATVTIAAYPLRRLVPTARHCRWLGVLGLRIQLFSRSRDRVIVNFLAVADVVGNWFGKSWLKRRWLVLPLFFRLLFAPLSTVAHPSAHVALVTRLWCRRQCHVSYRGLRMNHPSVMAPHQSCDAGICRTLVRMLPFFFRQLFRVCTHIRVVTEAVFTERGFLREAIWRSK